MRHLKITAELRDWRFDKKHRLEGRIYNDTRDIGFVDGDCACIHLVRYVADYGSYFVIKTSNGTAYVLMKEHEAIRCRDQNNLSIKIFTTGGKTE